MGYKSGTGLGKFEQGRVDIVHASKQRGRRGLGLHIAGLEPSDTIWDSEKDQVKKYLILYITFVDSLLFVILFYSYLFMLLHGVYKVIT